MMLIVFLIVFFTLVLMSCWDMLALFVCFQSIHLQHRTVGFQSIHLQHSTVGFQSILLQHKTVC